MVLSISRKLFPKYQSTTMHKTYPFPGDKLSNFEMLFFALLLDPTQTHFIRLVINEPREAGKTEPAEVLNANLFLRRLSITANIPELQKTWKKIRTMLKEIYGDYSTLLEIVQSKEEYLDLNTFKKHWDAFKG